MGSQPLVVHSVLALVEPEFDVLAARTAATVSDDVAEDRRNFSSYKFDLINALTMDLTLKYAWRLVGIRIVQYMNAETRVSYPSMQAIADDLGLSKRGVEKIIAGLQDRLWIQVEGRSHLGTNVYRVLSTHKNAILDRQISLRDSRKERRAPNRRSGGSVDSTEPQIASKTNGSSDKHLH